MIGSYRDKDTKQFAAGEEVRRWAPFRQAEKR
jgi:hypothetical protein